MANKLNTPSASFLIPREHRIKAIQELYDKIRSGGSGKISDFENDIKYISAVVPQELSESEKQLARDTINAESATTIVAPVNATDETLPVTALTTEIGKYYRLDVPVETLAVTLPAMGVVTSVKTVTIYLTGGTTPAVTITAADGKSVVLQDGYEIKAGKTYEVNCLYNGATWVVGALTINTGE